MRIVREDLLRALEAVAPGLSDKEIVDQATCFVFQGGRVFTLNDEVAASHPCPSGLEGAVPAKPLLELLRALTEADLDVESTPEGLQVKGKAKRSKIRREASVLMPLSSVEAMDPNRWATVHPELAEAIDLASQCTLKAGLEPWHLTCVHLAPGWVEACDNFQALRYPLATGMAQGAILTRSTAYSLVGSGMTEYQEGTNWIHFRNPAGLHLSLRRYVQDWVDISTWVAMDGTPASLPMGLAEAITRARIFSDGESVKINLKAGKLRLSTQNDNGSYEEQREVAYNGEPVGFLIAARLVSEVLKHGKDCLICQGAIKVDVGRFIYISALEVPEAGSPSPVPPPVNTDLATASASDDGLPF